MGKAPVVLWFFEEKNKRGRWKRLSWRMTDEDAQRHMERNGVELRKVENSREERQDYYGNGYGQIRVSELRARTGSDDED
jgi:hypothetical protein